VIRAAREGRRLVWLALLCAPGLPARARASEPPQASPSAPSVVRVYVAGPPAAVARARVTVTELCSRLELSAVVLEAQSDAVLATPSKDAFAEAFIDLRGGSVPRVIVLQGDTRRELERRTLPASSSLELAVEEAAHVLYMAVESALRAREARNEAAAAGGAGAGATGAGRAGASSAAGDGAGSAGDATGRDAAPGDATPSGAGDEAHRAGTDATPPSDGAPSRAATPLAAPAAAGADATSDTGAARTEPASPSGGARFEAEVAAYGSVLAFGPDHVLPGLGASLDLGARNGASRWSASLCFGATLPGKVNIPPESAELRADVARLLVAAEWDATSLLAIFIGIGGGVDRISFEPAPPPSGVTAVSSAPKLDPVAEGKAGLKLLLSRSGRAFAGVAMDLDLAPHRYVVESASATEPFFTTPRARPMAFVGLSFLLSGEGGGEAP
jgi:hypothetical protein